VFDEMPARKYFPRIERKLLGFDGNGSYILRMLYWANLISTKVLKKGS
jgi:hypothetical protein